MVSNRLVRRHEAIRRLGIGKTKFHSDIVEREGVEATIPGTRVPRLKIVHIGPRASACFEDELDGLIEALRAERDGQPITAPVPTPPRYPAARGGRPHMSPHTPQETEQIHVLFHKFMDSIEHFRFDQQIACDALELTLHDLLAEACDSEANFVKYYKIMLERGVFHWRRRNIVENNELRQPQC